MLNIDFKYWCGKILIISMFAVCIFFFVRLGSLRNTGNVIRLVVVAIALSAGKFALINRISKVILVKKT